MRLLPSQLPCTISFRYASKHRILKQWLISVVLCSASGRYCSAQAFPESACDQAGHFPVFLADNHHIVPHQRWCDQDKRQNRNPRHQSGTHKSNPVYRNADICDISLVVLLVQALCTWIDIASASIWSLERKESEIPRWACWRESVCPGLQPLGSGQSCWTLRQMAFCWS